VFTAPSLPPIAHEALMPPVLDIAAHVDVSTADSWDDYVRWERGLLADAFHDAPTLDALVDRLVADAKTPREKLDRLFHHVAQEVRYQQDYETTIAGVRPHRAPSVIERGYGDCKDKAVLLIQMAKRIGIKLSFAILRTTTHGKVASEVPNQQFNHAIVYVPKQPGFDEPSFMDPTSDGLDLGNLRGDDQGALALVLEPTTGTWAFVPIPYQSPELQYYAQKIHIDVKSPTEAIATDELTARGDLAMAMRHVLRNAGITKQVFDTIVSQLFPGATLRSSTPPEKEDTLHPLALSFELDASQSLRPEEDHFRLSMPTHLPLAHTIALKARETPLRFGPPETASYDIETKLPAGNEVVHAPKDFKVDSACFSVSRKAKVDGTKVNVHVDFVRRCSEVAIADYGSYREAVQQAMRKLDDDLVFGPAARKRAIAR
jgi:hypothetical protein